MTALRNISIIFIVLMVSTAYGQYLGYSPIDDSDISKWIPKLEIEYSGAYHFGDSEGESTLVLFFTGNEIIGQIKSGTWKNSDATDLIWLHEYQNLTNVRIDKNGDFYSDEYHGEFVFYNKNGGRKKCLKIYDSWSGATEKEGEYELGWKLDSKLSDIYHGKYSMASTQELHPKELVKLSSSELKIMRNEIFARYGFKFKEGGEMDKYFQNQNWYRPQHSDVNKFLTELEKRNIKLIQIEENRP